MGEINPTRIEHYIPQFYQRYWECPEHQGRLWVLQKRENSKVRHNAIKKNCSDDYLYEIDIHNPDNIFEHHYRDFEDKIAPIYADMIYQIQNICCLQRISEEQKDLICKLFAHFSARNPQNVYSADSLLVTLPFTLGYENRDFDERAVQNVYALGQSGAIDSFISKFEKQLKEKSITVLISDTPNIIFVDNIIERAKFHYFPLSPYIVVLFHDDIKTDRYIRYITLDEYDAFLKEYIESMETHRIFASSKEVLEAINNRYMFITVEVDLSKLLPKNMRHLITKGHK